MLRLPAPANRLLSPIRRQHRCLCTLAGKSTLAQQLAARLNLPNVLQTDIIYQVHFGTAQMQYSTVIMTFVDLLRAVSICFDVHIMARMPREPLRLG